MNKVLSRKFARINPIWALSHIETGICVMTFWLLMFLGVQASAKDLPKSYQVRAAEGTYFAVRAPHFDYLFETAKSVEERFAFGASTGKSCQTPDIAAYKQELLQKKKQIPQIESLAQELSAFLKKYPSLKESSQRRVSLVFSPACEVSHTVNVAAEADEGLIRVNMTIGESKSFELQKNILFHEMGHLVYHDIFSRDGNYVYLKFVSEAFADFFAYSITKDSDFGILSQDAYDQRTVVRTVKPYAGEIAKIRDWEMGQENPYLAGAKLREVLIQIGQKHGFEVAVQALKEVLSAFAKERTMNPLLEEPYLVLERVCSSVLSKY